MRASCSFLLAATCGFGISISAVAQSPAPPPLLARPPEPRVAKITLTGEERWKIALSHPKPEYPPDARRRHLSGKGTFHLHVSYETGDVTSVEILTGTGHRILDNAAVDALRRWKFRPHSVIGMKVPITFSISSKS
jgi:protein TonB